MSNKKTTISQEDKLKKEIEQLKSKLQEKESQLKGVELQNENLSMYESLVEDMEQISIMLKYNKNPDEDFKKLIERELLNLFSKTQPKYRGLSLVGSLDEVYRQIHETDTFPEKWGMDKIKIYKGLPITIGGYSGTGKSTFLVNLLYHNLGIGKDPGEVRKSIFFSNEMTKGQILYRLLDFKLYEEYYQNKKGYVLRPFQLHEGLNSFHKLLKTDKEEMKENREFFENFINLIEERLLIIDYRMPASEISNQVKSYINSFKPEQVYIDYLTNIEPEKDSLSLDKRNQIIETMSILTEAAKFTNLPFFIAAQQSRSGKQSGSLDHTGFQESASIEQNSAITIMLDKIGDNSLVCSVSKNRFGRTGYYEITQEVNTRFFEEGTELDKQQLEEARKGAN